MNNLITISYNLNVEIENQLSTIENIAIIDSETLTLARNERAKVNKIFDSFETERKKINKAINDEFKQSLKAVVDLRDTFDKNITEFVEKQKGERLAEIRAYFDSKTTLNWELAPQDEFLKAYPSFKSKVDLWVSKIKHELDAIKAFGDAAVELYNNTYDLAQTIAAMQPAADETLVKTTDYTSLTIVVPNEVKDEVITYLKSKGVMVR